MDTLDITTETRTLENMEQTAEKLKEVDSNMIREWLEGLVPGVLGFALQIFLALLVYAVGSRVIKLARKFLRKWLIRADADLGVRQFMDALLKFSLHFILAVIILTMFGVTTASVIAVVGSAGLAIGLALQGSLSNFAGGVLILMLKPFKVGDFIHEDTHGNEGTVTEISIFYTKLFTADRKTVVIPNGVLANSSLTNTTFSDIRRVDIDVGIAYEADLLAAKGIIQKIAERDEAHLPSEDILVFVAELGSSEVTLGLRVWVKTEDYWQAKWRLTERIKLAFDDAGIEIPYQKIDVQMRE